MSSQAKPLLRALAGETLRVPPVWLMRQAGRYLPEYRATREKAGSFLDLCYTPELAAEVTLQPIRRFGFDAAILFADILLVPQGLGVDLTFVQGEGPRLSTVTTAADVAALRPAEAIHDTVGPVYETVKILSEALPPEVALIGFAGAPWTVATYMVAGRGTPSQEPARRMMLEQPEAFFALLDRITEATIEYLARQVEAGAEAVKLFDSWAGSLSALDFERACLEPNRRITAELKSRFPGLPVIAFPRGAGAWLEDFADACGADCVAIDQHVPARWAAERLQPKVCVQGNLDPLLMVAGGQPLRDAARRIRDDLSGGPHVFNLGHGITPDADPENVHVLLDAIRG
ncbi:uroporphyrinogen decarboxylase [Albimonas sp. CAU 1670]|uniref:uroporphyrinogen decarboxylase n=1 Tax=Albimonas sp. CAU 1670 TaxID=3032599 RepID=UPI0023DC7D93|nr:uroporphyrinogen decarboxylase [Albimonas sp. CAU 1670]MDF2231190.1 uroporphyrinogen decarboxylase [Albimonas sp. CAU 1670]